MQWVGASAAPGVWGRANSDQGQPPVWSEPSLPQPCSPVPRAGGDAGGPRLTVPSPCSWGEAGAGVPASSGTRGLPTAVTTTSPWHSCSSPLCPHSLTHTERQARRLAHGAPGSLGSKPGCHRPVKTTHGQTQRSRPALTVGALALRPGGCGVSTRGSGSHTAFDAQW